MLHRREEVIEWGVQLQDLRMILDSGMQYRCMLGVYPQLLPLS